MLVNLGEMKFGSVVMRLKLSLLLDMLLSPEMCGERDLWITEVK